jgi:hypothetical protein
MREADNFNELAAQAIADRRWSEARELLENALAGMPADWRAAREGENVLHFASRRPRSINADPCPRKAREI